MTTRQIVAIFLFYIGAHLLLGSLLRGSVVAGGIDASVTALFILGVASIVAGILALREQTIWLRFQPRLKAS